MARNFYKLTERSFIHDALREVGEVVQFEDDPKAKGMRPGTHMVLCDADGGELRAPRGKKASAVDDIG